MSVLITLAVVVLVFVGLLVLLGRRSWSRSDGGRGRGRRTSDLTDAQLMAQQQNSVKQQSYFNF